MRTPSNDKNICNDKWLSALVDAMDDVETERADDMCRVTAVSSAFFAQLQRHAAAVPRFNVAA